MTCGLSGRDFGKAPAVVGWGGDWCVQPSAARRRGVEWVGFREVARPAAREGAKTRRNAKVCPSGSGTPKHEYTIEELKIRAFVSSCTHSSLDFAFLCEERILANRTQEQVARGVRNEAKRTQSKPTKTAFSGQKGGFDDSEKSKRSQRDLCDGFVGSGQQQADRVIRWRAGGVAG